jgi:transposase
MVSIKTETNIEVLREYTQLLEKEVLNLGKKIEQLKGGDPSDQQWLNSLEDQLTRLKKKIFVSGRESLPKEDRPVGHEKETLKLHGERPQKEDDDSRPDEFQSDCKIQIYTMDEDLLKEESELRGITRGAKAWEPMKNCFADSREITIIERSYVTTLQRRQKYKLKKRYNNTGKDVIITAPGPVKIKEGSKYSVDFAITVARDKYEYHLPLERQRRQMEAQGLKIDVKTLYSFCENLAHHCEKVTARIKQEIQDDFCSVHIDESPWPVQGQDSKSYMWALSNRKGSYYQFEPSRSGKIARELLKNYSGSVVSDGYAGYAWIKKDKIMRLGHCWSHARREFYERIPDYPEAKEAVELINKLFQIESKARSFDELSKLRKTESKKIIEELHSWMLKTRASYLKQEGIHKAIHYCLKLWPELTAFLSDLSIPLSNNDAERALRHVVMGRKNFNGSKTINGADTAATIYTVIESCKKVGLQPSQYLKYLVTRNWYGDRPMTPHEASIKMFGKNDRVIFPEPENWKVQ